MITPDELLVLRHAAPELNGDVFRPLNERLLAMKVDLWRDRVTKALNNLVARGVLRCQRQESIGWDGYQLNGEHPAIKALTLYNEEGG